MPFRRSVLWVTLIFFLILAGVGVYESFQQHSMYPLLERTVLKVVASDRLLGHLAEQVAAHETPPFTGFFQKTFPTFIWFWLKFFFDAVSSLYFIFFFGWLIYWLFSVISNTSPMRNVLLMLLTYVVLTFIISTMLFMADNAGRTLPATKGESMKVWLLGSYPGQGVSKFVMMFAAPSALKSVADWSESGDLIPSIITNIPSGTVKLNDTVQNSTNATARNITSV